MSSGQCLNAVFWIFFIIFSIVLLSLSGIVVLAVMLSACFMISNGAMKSNRVGLSEYTARRLAELRARRAEADDTGGISIGSPSATSDAAEVTVNDSDSSVLPPAVTTPQPTAAPTYSRSASSGNTTAPVLSSAQPPSDGSFSTPKTPSQVISAPTAAAVAATAAASNGVSEQSSEAADMAAKHRQLLNDVLESSPSPKQHRIDKQDLSNARAATELIKPPIRHHEIPQPSQFARSGSRSIDATPVEVGAASKMVSALAVISWLYNKDFGASFITF